MVMLREMFSPLGGPKADEEEIDWADDLKFYIDNNNELLTRFIFPAVAKHQSDPHDDRSYKLYIKPLRACIEDYCREYGIKEKGKTFPPEVIIRIAKRISEEQKKHIDNGAYDQ
jgi:hypothetical protein